MKHRGDVASVALSGTYNMTIALQKELGSPGSGSWREINRWSTADATVAYNYVTQGDNERLRLIVLVDTSGTCTATLLDTTDKLLEEQSDGVGMVRARYYQDGPVFYNQDGDVVFDGRQSQAIINLSDANASISAANSGKTHLIANVSADRTFTLPPVEDGLRYKFVAEVGAADGHDWIFVANATANLFKGGVLMVDTDAGPATVAAVVADQSDDDQLQVNLPQGGTAIEMYCDGTYWIVSGVVVSATAAVFS
jgi:hypothetical protein